MTTIKRRDFLKLSSLALAVTSGMPAFLARAAQVAHNSRRLVVIQLSGGNDGLNTLVPYSNGAYYAARPNIAISKREVLPLNADLGLHPALKPILAAYEDQELAWIESVGYPNPNRSHFASMAVWHSADPSGNQKEGWIGRIAEQLGDPFCASNIGKLAPHALRSDQFTLPSMANLDQYQLKLPKGYNPTFERMMQLSRQNEAAFIAESIQSMRRNTAKTQASLNKYRSGSPYPQHKFAQSLQNIAQLIAADQGQRILYTSLGGFDTHASQRADQDQLLGDLASGLAAFRQDLKLQGLDDQVMVLAFSEFGRRVAENASGGTDHGQGGVMFALGKQVKGGIYGSSPDLERLVDGDIRYQQDFRGIYARVLDQWLDIPSKAILGGSYASPHFV